MAFAPLSPIAAFPAASFLLTPKCRSHSKAKAWLQNLPAWRSISPAPTISELSRSAPTSPVSFASTLRIRISFLPATSKNCSPADSTSHVPIARSFEILSGQTHNSPSPPLRPSLEHYQSRPLPYRKSRRPRSLRGPPQRPHRGNGSLSARDRKSTRLNSSHL